jgi:hypothetical protein
MRKSNDYAPEHRPQGRAAKRGENNEIDTAADKEYPKLSLHSISITNHNMTFSALREAKNDDNNRFECAKKLATWSFALRRTNGCERCDATNALANAQRPGNDESRADQERRLDDIIIAIFEYGWIPANLFSKAKSHEECDKQGDAPQNKRASDVERAGTGLEIIYTTSSNREQRVIGTILEAIRDADVFGAKERLTQEELASEHLSNDITGEDLRDAIEAFTASDVMQQDSRGIDTAAIKRAMDWHTQRKEDEENDE